MRAPRELVDEVFRTPMPIRFGIRFGPFCVGVATNDATLTASIREKADPYFVVEDRADAPVASIALVACPTLDAAGVAPDDGARRITIFGSGRVRREEALCWERDGVRVVRARSHLVAVEPARCRFAILVAGAALDSYVALHRALLPLFTRAAEHAGAVAVHGSVAASADGAVLVMGAKGAGKTTATLELLFQHHYSFVSNDIALVVPDDPVTVYGIPEAMRAGVGAMMQHAPLAPLVDAAHRLAPPDALRRLPDGEKKLLFVMQLRSLLPAHPPIRPSAALRCIVWSVLLDDPFADAHCAALAPAEIARRLDQEVLSPENPARPHWIGLFPTPADEVQHSRRRLLDLVTARVPAYELRRGYRVADAVRRIPGVGGQRSTEHVAYRALPDAAPVGRGEGGGPPPCIGVRGAGR